MLKEPERCNERARLPFLALCLFVVQSAVVYPLRTTSSASP